MLNGINIFDCHPLFEDVQMNHVFEDGKTFLTVCQRVIHVIILQQYLKQRTFLFLI
jgi:hypothetical protein